MDSDFFDQLGTVVANTARELGERAEVLYEKQKIRGQILLEERATEKAFASLGKAVYAHYMDGTSIEEGLEDFYVEIKNHRKKMNDLKKSMKEAEQKVPKSKPEQSETAVRPEEESEKESEREAKPEEEVADAAWEVKDAVEEKIKETEKKLPEDDGGTES